MRLHNLFRGMVCIIPLVLAACGGDPTPFDLELVVNDCDATRTSVIPPNGSVVVTVSGEGMSNVSKGAWLRDRSLSLPEVATGKNRIATVEVFDGTTAIGAGNLVAVGTSASFEVSENDTPKVTVVMYRVNGFALVRADGTGCSTLAEGRAGHTARLLQDGRVLIAGGYTVDESQAKRFLADAEIFDPATGTFASAGKICEGADCMAVAFSKSVLLRDGRVLIVGGEEEGGAVSARTAIFDPDDGSWTLGPELETGRRGHTATLVNANGAVLVVGGVDAEGQVVPTVEVFEPSANRFRTARVEIPRAFHGASPAGAGAVLVAGGIDAEGVPLATSRIVLWSQGSDDYDLNPARDSLAAGSLRAGFVSFGGTNFASVGGAKGWQPEAGSPGAGVPSSYTEEAQWFHGTDPREKGVGLMQAKRLDPCVVALDAKRALVVGGFQAGNSPLANSDVLALVPSDGSTREELAVAPPANGGALKETKGRGYTTCTALGDGRVVVIGGLRNDGTVAASAEIYVAQQARETK